MTESLSTLVIGLCLGNDGNPVPKTFQFKFFFKTWVALNKAKFMLVTMKLFTGVKDKDKTSASTI